MSTKWKSTDPTPQKDVQGGGHMLELLPLLPPVQSNTSFAERTLVMWLECLGEREGKLVCCSRCNIFLGSLLRVLISSS